MRVELLMWMTFSFGVSLLKNVGIPEYYLGGIVELLRDSWKHFGLGLAISARTYIQNVIPR
jgi:hypothetical protein